MIFEGEHPPHTSLFIKKKFIENILIIKFLLKLLQIEFMLRIFGIFKVQSKYLIKI